MRDIAELRKGEKKDAYEKFKEGRDKRIDEAFHELFHDSSIPIESMPELFDIFLSIYGGTLWGVSLSDIAYHFLEEVGEVSKEITYLETICGRHSRESWSELVKKDLGKGLEWDKYSEVCTGISRELADVFSWTTALCGKIFQQAKPKPDWKPREALVKVYIGDIPGSKKRRSVSLGLDSYDFICRYCDKKECSQGCIQEQIRKRIKEGMDESNMRFKYEVDIPRAGITKT